MHMAASPRCCCQDVYAVDVHYTARELVLPLFHWSVVNHVPDIRIIEVAGLVYNVGIFETDKIVVQSRFRPQNCSCFHALDRSKFGP